MRRVAQGGENPRYDRRIMHRFLFALALSILIPGLLPACSSSGDVASNANGGHSAAGGSGGGSGSGGMGGIGSQSCTASAECGTGYYCSKADVCLAAGKCAVNADCNAPDVCGQGSHTCLASGTCLFAGDCPTGQTCDTTSHKCSLGGACGKIEFTHIAPNVLILLDRSGSMHNDAGGNTRWNVAKTAIQSVTTTYDADIRFGLATYSACLSGGCSAGSIVVPIAPTNAAKVNGFLSDKLDQGSSNGQNQVSGGIQYLCDSGDPETSTGKSLHALAGEPSLQDTTRQNAVLLLTDGEESSSCVSGGKDGPTSAAELLAQSPSVKTFVVGLGVNASSLDAVAQAGGTGKLVSAQNQTELNAALDSIASQISSCDLKLGTVPPDPTQVYVYFNGDSSGVANDPNNGFSYDPATNTIHFHGAACDSIQQKHVNSIVVGFGCKGQIPS